MDTILIITWPKLVPLLFYSVLPQTILLIKGEPMSGKGLMNWAYLPLP